MTLTFLIFSPAAVLPVGYGIREQCGPGCGVGGCNTPVFRAVLQPAARPPRRWTGFQVPLGTLRTFSCAKVPAISC